jgi:hypothetical protein
MRRFQKPIDVYQACGWVLMWPTSFRSAAISACKRLIAA